jgi:Predicted amidophosphoribosyltransferases
MKKIFLLFQNLLSMFYPRLCPACKQNLFQYEKVICSHCLTHLPETNYHLEKDNPLNAIFRGRIELRQVAALLFYQKGNMVQNLLHQLKYKGKQEVGIVLGQYYGNKLIQQIDFADIDMIIPIPLHPKKQKQRGYNQSECLAKGLSESMKIPYYTDILKRELFTQTQTKKDRFNRWKNVKDVFVVEDYENISGKKIMLCDDVLTTGATIEAAAQTLIQGTEIELFVVTIATAY